MKKCVNCGKFLSRDEEDDSEDMASDFQELDVIYCCDRCMYIRGKGDIKNEE